MTITRTYVAAVKLSLRFPILALLIVTTGACKPSRGGDVSLSSLDHFTDTAPVGARNTCGPERTKHAALYDQVVARHQAFVTAPNKVLERALAAAMAAIPAPLLAGLTGDALATRFVADNAAVATYCNSAFESETERTWFLEQDSSAKVCWKKEEGRGVVIFFTEDEALIRHSMVRAATYVYTQLLEKSYVQFINRQPQAAKDALLNEHMRVLADRQKLGEKLLEDLQQQGRQDKYQRLIGLYSDPDAFSNYVFAEAVDSYYCSPETHEVFQSKLFSGTFGTFKAGPDSIHGQLGAAWFE